MTLVAASAALLINKRRANYCREPSIRREGCISGESNWRSVRLDKEEIIAILADEYARWRSDKVLNQRQCDEWLLNQILTLKLSFSLKPWF